MRTSVTGEIAKKMLTEGRSKADVMEATGLSYSTVHYHAQKLGQTGGGRIDWKAVQGAYDAGSTHAEIMEAFGITSSNIRTARQRGYVVMPNSYDARRRQTNAERITRLEENVTAIWTRLVNVEMAR